MFNLTQIFQPSPSSKQPVMTSAFMIWTSKSSEHKFRRPHGVVPPYTDVALIGSSLVTGTSPSFLLVATGTVYFPEAIKQCNIRTIL